jgi:hypothetical protein
MDAHSNGWREVSKDEFFKAIGSQDVHPSPVGPWPYTSLFKTRSGDVRAKIVNTIPEGAGLPVSRFFLPTLTQGGK